MSTYSAGAAGARRVGGHQDAASLTRTRLAWLQATYRRGWALALWLCLTATIALTAVLPLIDSMAVQSGLGQTLAQDGSLTVEQQVTGVDGFGAFHRDVDRQMAARMGGEIVPLAAYATATPLFAITLNGDPVQPAVLQQRLTAAYTDHLAAHVDLVEGQVPPDGLGGGDTAVTVQQSTATALGLRLSDRFCIDFTATGDRQARWCARLVGIWRPLSAHDPFWGGGAPPRLQVQMGRFDFFELQKLRASQPVTAGVRYWPNMALFDAEGAPAVAGQVGQVRADLPRQSQRRVTTRLDASLARYSAQQRATTFTIHLFAAGVVLLALAVVGLAASRFVNGQARELAVLRARGWPRERVWRVAFLGLGSLALVALPVGLVLCLLMVLVLMVSGSSLSALLLNLDDVRGTAAAVVVAAGAIVAALGALAAVPARGEAGPEVDVTATEPYAAWRRRRVGLALAGAGVLALLLLRLPGFSQLASGGPDVAQAWLPIAPALGVALLAAAAAGLRPFAAAGWPPLGSTAGRLARVQLERCPEQYAGTAFAVTLAAALGTYGAVAIAASRTPQLPDALSDGITIAVLTGFAGALALALAGFGLHFRAVTRRRLQEYGGLFAHGLPAAEVARSVALEQVAVVWPSLFLGGILGLVLTALALPLPDAGAGPAVLGIALAGACLLVGFVALGSRVRRVPARINPLRRRRS